MIDIVREIQATQRDVGPGRTAAGEGRTIHLQRTYEAAIDEVWDALTNPERISRWFLPISGDFRISGRYQLEGNAGGEILACDRPHRFRLTWAYGETGNPADVSELEVRLRAGDDGATSLELDHTAIVPDDMWAEYGPGAVGVGWDQGLLGLAIHLRGESIDDPAAWLLTAEGRTFVQGSSEAWGEANRAAGADPGTVERAVANTTAFYAPDPETA